jgi:hypothetical protein
MKLGLLLSAIFWGLLGTYLTGCAGIEAVSKFGLYAVDDRHELQETKSRAKPLICMWRTCDSNGNIIQGS